MDSVDQRQKLVEAGAINAMAAGGIKLGFEWSKLGPDNIDERVFDHLQRLQRISQAPPRILDLGCANGARLFRYAMAGARCIGVDIADTSADEIRKLNEKLIAHGKLPIIFIKCDIRKLEASDFAKDDFAAIICAQVAHFLERDDNIQVMQFIKQASSPTTLTCLSFDTDGVSSTSPLYCKHLEMLWDERMRVMRIMGYTPASELKHRYYTETDMAIGMEKAGFKLCDTLRDANGVCVLVGSTSEHDVFNVRPAFVATLRQRLEQLMR